MKQIELRASIKGLLPSIILNVIGLTILWFVTNLMKAQVTEMLMNERYYHDMDFWKYLFSNHGPDEKILYMVGIILAIGAKIIWSIALFSSVVYASTKRITLKLDDNNKVISMIVNEMSFIWSRAIKEAPCNRILSIKVTHPTLGSITNSGEIAIEFASFANADSSGHTWYIDGVENPDVLVKQIADAVPNYEGIKIAKDK